MSTEQQYLYDVAISYAGEDRDYAQALADALRSRNVKVFYDRYEQTTLWGKNLYEYLSDLYQHKARYCVMLLSQYYASKVWTTHERRAAQNRAVRENEEYILPICLDNTKMPGHLDTLAHLNWHEVTLDFIVNALLEKLGHATRDLRTDTTPQTKEYWLLQGDLLSAQRSYEVALAAYDQAIALDPHYSEAYRKKGDLLLYYLRRYAKALAVLEQASKLNSEFADVERKKATIQDLYLRRREEMLTAFEQAIDLEPQRSEAYNSKGNALLYLERYEEALAAYERAIVLNANFAAAYQNKGDVLSKLGRRQEAQQAYKRAEELGFIDL